MNGAIPNECIKEAVVKSGADVVLVTCVLRVDLRVRVASAVMSDEFYDGFYGWYGSTWPVIPPSAAHGLVVKVNHTKESCRCLMQSE